MKEKGLLREIASARTFVENANQNSGSDHTEGQAFRFSHPKSNGDDKSDDDEGSEATLEWRTDTNPRKRPLPGGADGRKRRGEFEDHAFESAARIHAIASEGAASLNQSLRAKYSQQSSAAAVVLAGSPASPPAIVTIVHEDTPVSEASSSVKAGDLPVFAAAASGGAEARARADAASGAPNSSKADAAVMPGRKLKKKKPEAADAPEEAERGPGAPPGKAMKLTSAVEFLTARPSTRHALDPRFLA